MHTSSRTPSAPARMVTVSAAILLLGVIAAPSVHADAAAGLPALASDVTSSVRFPQPTRSTEAYQAVGKAYGVHVLFDPKIHDSLIALELEGVSAKKALDLLTVAAGHFYTLIDESTVLIADDTPQNRRAYETQVARTFHLRNLELTDALTLVRSLIGLKNVAVNQALNALVVRDTAAKVAVADRLLASVDRPRGEVAVDVELLYVDSAALERVAGESGRTRLEAPAFAELRRSARRLTRQELSVLDRDRGLWTLKDGLDVKTSATSAAHFEVGFELAVTPRVHASDEVTLEIGLALEDAVDDGAGTIGPVTSRRKVESGARMESGETLLLTGLGVGSGGGGRSLLASRFDLAEDGGDLVLALTPRVVRGPGFTESDLAAVCVGTETVIELCGGDEPTRTASMTER